MKVSPKLSNLIRSHYPKAFGIRRHLQQMRVQRLRSHFLTVEEIRKGEENPSLKAEVIAPYLERWSDYLKPYVKEMEMILEKSPVFRTREDREKLRADILFCKLAYGFLPSEYSGWGIEHKTVEERKTYASDIDRFVFCYSVSDITKLQQFMDKGKEYKLLSKYYQRDAVSLEKEKDYSVFRDFISKHPVFVKKCVYLSMGNSIELIDSKASGKTEKELFTDLISQGKVILEEKIEQHEIMAKLNASSVNTIRCSTFITKHGVEVPFCFLKAGRNGAFVDNAGAGGIVMGIDPKDGICKTDGFTEYGESFEKHPETGVVFRGFQLPDWDAMIALCKKMALENPEVRYVGWDMAYTAKGWVVVEANGLGQFIIPQIVWQRGIKEEINAYFAEMEHVV